MPGERNLFVASGQSPCFPETSLALEEPNGLLAVGGELNQEWLLKAYGQGIFPWYEADQPILWWTPNPRLVLFPEKIHISKTLKKLIRQQPFQISADQCFTEVIKACAGPRHYADGTWITNDMQAAYIHLYEQGFAHSVEIWQDSNLVGGLYGIALGNVFYGESMFSHTNNSSKVAFVHLAKQLQLWQYKLIDCQVSSEHLLQFGTEEIPREEFEEYLPAKTGQPYSPDLRWQSYSSRLDICL